MRLEATPLVCGVELGGSKCACLLGRGPDDILAEAMVPTAAPAATLARISSVLERWRAEHAGIAAIGVASFGPLDLRQASRTFGHITAAAKRGWAGIDVAGVIGTRQGLPLGLNTDVNAALLAEGRWGAGVGFKDLAYVTVGTGVGVGLLVGGRLAVGCSHPELGHIRVPRVTGDTWPGICSYHGDCLEGIASGPAISARAGMPAEALPSDSPIWELVAHALAQLTQTILLSTAPGRILIGGGVAQGRPELLSRVRHLMAASLNGYLDLEDLTGGIHQYVQPPGLGRRAGPLGALALGLDAATR